MKHFIKHSIDYQLTNNPPCYLGDEVVKGLFGIGSSIIGGIGKLFGAKDANQKNFEYNQKLMEQQQRYNVQNMNMQRDINKDLARYGYDLENEYNSPSVQKAKMLAAGLNPYYNDAGATSAASNPNMQQVSQPSVSIPNFQAQSSWSAFANLPSEFANIANATKAIAEAKKAGVETEMQERAMDDYLNDIHERWRGSKLANDYQEVISNWYQQNGDSYLNEQDRKLSVEIGNLCAQGNLADAENLLTHEKYKQLENENSLWSQIKDYIVRQKAAEAEDAEARVDATKAQADMYRNQGIAALRQADAAIRQALTAESNGKVYRVNLRSAAKLNDAQLTKMASELVGAYVDEHGLHVDDDERKSAQALLKRQLVAQTKSADAKAKQDRFNTYNPFTYLGQLFGGSGTAVISKVIK